MTPSIAGIGPSEQAEHVTDDVKAFATVRALAALAGWQARRTVGDDGIERVIVGVRCFASVDSALEWFGE